MFTQKIRHDATLGKNIRAHRMKNRLTQEQVVAQLQVRGCNMSRETYAKIESGIANIRAVDLAALCEIFRTDCNSLFDGIHPTR